jgi:hypothetical protein
MGNCVIIVSPQDFKNPSHWCFKLEEITRYDFGLASCGAKSATNSMAAQPLSRYYMRTDEHYRRRPSSRESTLIQPDDVIKDNAITHAQRIRGNVAPSSSHLANLSIREIATTNCRKFKNRDFWCGLGYRVILIIFMPNFTTIRSPFSSS